MKYSIMNPAFQKSKKRLGSPKLKQGLLMVIQNE
jgi:hypothetical protein